MSKKHVARKVYEAFLNGDHLTDAEVAEGIKHFETLENGARAAGPHFALAAREAGRVTDNLRSIYYERRR